jgi:hypothetical protein
MAASKPGTTRRPQPIRPGTSLAAAPAARAGGGPTAARSTSTPVPITNSASRTSGGDVSRSASPSGAPVLRERLGSAGSGSSVSSSGSLNDLRPSTTTRVMVPLRLTRPSSVPELRRWHAWAEVSEHPPARLRSTCAVCQTAITWPRPKTYWLCRRCLVPVHAACRARVPVPDVPDVPSSPIPSAAPLGGTCDDRGQAAAAVAVVDSVLLALADKVARLDALDDAIAQGGRDRRMSLAGLREDATVLAAERKAELVRERAALLSTDLVAVGDVGPDAARVTRMDERLSLRSVAGSVRDRVLSALG